MLRQQIDKLRMRREAKRVAGANNRLQRQLEEMQKARTAERPAWIAEQENHARREPRTRLSAAHCSEDAGLMKKATICEEVSRRYWGTASEIRGQNGSGDGEGSKRKR